MSDIWRNLSANLASFVAPGLVLLLLGIQVAFGLRGFDRPDDSLLYVLQVPGVLLGWGGVAMLLPLLAWMTLDWWGYDLNGFALKGLGSAVLGVAVGAIFGLSGGIATGGLVGGGLANVLADTVGSVAAWVLLLLMAAPACVLALSLQRGAQRPEAPSEKPQARDRSVPDRKERAGGRPSKSGAALESNAPAQHGRRSLLSRVGALLGGSSKTEDQAWYPQQRFDAAGNEVPMEFNRSRDVGGVRFADESESGQEEPAAIPAAPADSAGPGSDAPGSDAPGSDAPGSDAPGSDAPGSDAPGSDAPGSDAPGGDAPSAGQLLSGEERLPTIPELLAGNFSEPAGGSPGGPLPGGGFAVAAGSRREDPSGGPRETPGDTPEDGPIHVDGEGRPIQPRPSAPDSPAAASHAQASQSAGSRAEVSQAGEPSSAPIHVRPPVQPPLPFATPVRFESPTEGALADGVRYADEPLESKASAPADGAPGSADEARSSAAAQAQLSEAVCEAVRGPVPVAGDAKAQGSARAIRKSLRESVAALQVDGASERHLAKLDAMGLFDTLEAPPKQAR